MAATTAPAAPGPSRLFLRPRRMSSGLTSDGTASDNEDGELSASALSPVDEEGNGQQAFYFGERGVKLEPYGLKHDPTVRWVYNPATLALAAVGASIVAGLAYNSERIFPRQLREHLSVRLPSRTSLGLT